MNAWDYLEELEPKPGYAFKEIKDDGWRNACWGALMGGEQACYAIEERLDDLLPLNASKALKDELSKELGDYVFRYVSGMVCDFVISALDSQACEEELEDE